METKITMSLTRDEAFVILRMARKADWLFDSADDCKTVQTLKKALCDILDIKEWDL